MPLIKDKYAAKYPKIRSDYERGIGGKSVDQTLASDIVTTQRTTEQKQQDITIATRKFNAETTGEAKIITSPSITGYKISTINTIENFYTLNPGDALKDIIISYQSGDGSSVVSLGWSTSSMHDLVFDSDAVSNGLINTVPSTTGITQGLMYRLFADTFVTKSTISLSSNGITQGFSKLSVPVYFYIACNILGVDITILKA